MFKACIFDLDGVLVDTAKYHYLSWKKLCNHLGFDLSPDQFTKMNGLGRLDSLEYVLEIGELQLSDQEKHKYTEVKNSWYKAHVAIMTKDEILPGAIELLAELKSAGIKLGLASSSKNAKEICQAIDISQYFDAIVDGNMIESAKPNPEVFLHCAHLMDVAPEETVVFEDSLAGLQAGKSGGFLTIGLKPILTEADHLIESLEELTTKRLQHMFY